MEAVAVLEEAVAVVVEVKMIKKLKLNVEGMHCASCETLIKDVLSDENVKASVDSKKGEVIIEYDDSKINLDKIKSLIENEGYKVKN